MKVVLPGSLTVRIEELDLIANDTRLILNGSNFSQAVLVSGEPI